jgi:hypothetical protein
VDYASLYLEGAQLSSHLPEYLRDDWDDATKKLAAFRRSLQIARVDSNETCFFDMVPQRFLVELCVVKNKITEYIFKTLPKPERYEFYKYVALMLEDISNRQVNVDRQKARTYLTDPKLRHQSALLLAAPYVRYNQFGTKTGRLTTQAHTFPILTLNKSLRVAIKPQNDYFMELDFNGAEVRTLLGLLGKEQPSEDIHQYHLDHIFKSLSTRDEAKVAFFAWLYGSRTAAHSDEAEELSMFYNKAEILRTYYHHQTVATPYGKKICDVTPHHALNYLVQSTAAELTIKQALKLDYLFRTRGTGSYIAFLIHDAVVIDMRQEDEHLRNAALTLMRSTNFGTFGVNIKEGHNLGTMSDVRCG